MQILEFRTPDDAVFPPAPYLPIPEAAVWQYQTDNVGLAPMCERGATGSYIGMVFCYLLRHPMEPQRLGIDVLVRA